MSTTRILFVDDEPYILDAFRNLFRRCRRDWETVCATSGAEALEALARERIDIAVCDMRMPGMDGADLLGRIRDEFPRVVRIVMSGQAERDAVMRALPGAQQFLSKPCESDELRRVIERAAELSRVLNDEALRSAVGRLDKLPSSPTTFRELSRVAASPEARIDDIAGIVENDPAMSAKVLQLVNSAYFGLARPSASIRHAVAYLGVDLLKGLTLTASVFTAMEVSPVKGFSIEALQRRSLRCARLAKRFRAGTPEAEAAFTAGLMHDIGKIVLALGMPERTREVLEEVRRTGRPWHVIEGELFGVTHAAVGAFLLGAWGLPYDVVEAVAYHHAPAGVEGDGVGVLAAVHVAAALVASRDGPSDADGIDRAFLEANGLAGDLDAWKELVATELGREAP
jgi:HD-like signal output (HDOD) protein